MRLFNQRYTTPDKRYDIADGYDDEYMVYLIAEGDATKMDQVLDMEYCKAVRWLLLKKYENWVLWKKSKES